MNSGTNATLPPVTPFLVSWAMVAHPADCPCSSCVGNRSHYGDGYLDAKKQHRAAYEATA